MVSGLLAAFYTEIPLLLCWILEGRERSTCVLGAFGLRLLQLMCLSMQHLCLPLRCETDNNEVSIMITGLTALKVLGFAM